MALVSISLLSIFLLIAIFYVYKQMKRVAAARHEVIDANKRLKELMKNSTATICTERSQSHLRKIPT